MYTHGLSKRIYKGINKKSTLQNNQIFRNFLKTIEFKRIKFELQNDLTIEHISYDPVDLLFERHSHP